MSFKSYFPFCNLLPKWLSSPGLTYPARRDPKLHACLLNGSSAAFLGALAVNCTKSEAARVQTSTHVGCESCQLWLLGFTRWAPGSVSLPLAHPAWIVMTLKLICVFVLAGTPGPLERTPLCWLLPHLLHAVLVSLLYAGWCIFC